MAFVEIVEAMERAHLHDFVRRLMIAREHVDFVAAAFENLAVAVDAFVPGTLIAGGEVEIGFRREQFLEPLPIVVDVGKEEELHGWGLLQRILPVEPRETREVRVAGAKLGVLLDGESGEMSVGCEVARSSKRLDQGAQDGEM